MAYLTNNTDSFSSRTIILGNDMDLDSKDWIPIGNGVISNKFFKGTFDGNNKTISNMKIDSNLKSLGLFGRIDGSVAVVKDLTVKNLSIRGSYTSDGCFGAIAGEATGSSIISGCINIGSSVTATASSAGVGGIVGSVDTATIRGCSNSGTISGYSVGGGIVGAMWNNGVISDCSNAGAVSAINTTSATVAGGIVGKTGNASIIVRNCYNNGAIAAVSTGYTGGIVGNTFATITNCYSNTIIGSGGTGKIGAIAGNATTAPTYCYWRTDNLNTPPKCIGTASNLNTPSNCSYFINPTGNLYTYSSSASQTSSILLSTLNDQCGDNAKWTLAYGIVTFQTVGITATAYGSLTHTSILTGKSPVDVTVKPVNDKHYFVKVSMKHGTESVSWTAAERSIIIPNGYKISDAISFTINWGDASFYTGTSPCTIDSAPKLAHLAKLVNGGNSFSGNVVNLVSDLSLEGYDWTPIGAMDKPFREHSTAETTRCQTSL